MLNVFCIVQREVTMPWEILMFIFLTSTMVAGSSIGDQQASSLKTGEAPLFVKTRPRYFDSNVGDSVRLKCRVTGNPRPVVMWYKKGKSLQQKDVVNGFKYRDQGQMLKFDSVALSDGGNYTCTASNSYGVVNRTIELLVIDRFATRPILWHGTPENQTVLAGDNVTFRCEVRSDPRPHIKWLHTIEIPSGGASNERFVNQHLTSTDATRPEHFTITNVGTADAGTYTCIAGNVVGFSFIHFRLSVFAVPSLPLLPLLSQTVLVGNNVSFYCETKKEPALYIEWFRKSEFRCNDSDMEHVIVVKASWLNTDNDDDHDIRRLTLTNVTYEDSGEYICLVVSSAGSQLQSYRLKVL